MAETIHLNTDVLSWATQKIGLSLEAFARDVLKITKDKQKEKVLRGELTLTNAKELAQKTNTPFGFLFLDTPPEEFKLNADFIDFRTVKSAEAKLSDEFIETYQDILYKIDWYKEYLLENDADQLPFVGKYQNSEGDNKTIAKDIRETLEFASFKRKNNDDFLKEIIKKCEEKGILIFQNSVVRNNNHRGLRVEEFRGFVIADTYAPAIFLNTKDSENARIFTIAHELAHLWLGQSGVSDTAANSKNTLEAKCNDIAAEILVPLEQFLLEWNKYNDDVNDKIIRLNHSFKVSELVISRVALNNGKITQTAYGEIQAKWDAIHKKAKADLSQKDGGATFTTMLPLRNSRIIKETVKKLYNTNNISTKEASQLLNAPIAKVGNYL
jgi:Zn-dependent peptidase ImmA (M78 family)